MAPANLSALGLDELLAKEWLATNGLGGYASSSVAGLHTRKYHGLLVAAMTPPRRRMVLLSRVEESFFLNGGRYSISCNEYPGTVHPRGCEYLRAFNYDPIPRWGYQGDGWTIEKSLTLLRGRNTAVICYSLLGAKEPIEMELRPLFALRDIHDLAYQRSGQMAVENKDKRHHRILATTRTPEVFFAHDGEFDAQPYWYLNTIYRREPERGYAGLEDLWSPGVIRSTLKPGQTVHLVCSTDPIDFDASVIDADRQHAQPARMTVALPTPVAQRPACVQPPACDPAFDALLHAADQFVVADTQLHPSVMSTYPWPSPCVRASLASLTGLLLVPARFDDAKALLQHLFDHVRDGLVPSDFPEDGSPCVYHAADTALWLIKAVDDYRRYSGDEQTVQQKWLEPMHNLLKSYRRGTGLGIFVDATGLISSKAAGVGTTWMDANVNGWVVTPRQGKPVELNALWYNALCTVAGYWEKAGRADLSDELATLAGTVKTSFNISFWNEAAGCCFDVIDEHGREASIRPNQLLAMTLPYPVLASEFHAAVLEKVREHLLTPVGLRTLAPSDPAYQGRYAGNVINRDRAYHNGSVYPWLLGWYAKALIRVTGRTGKTIDAVRKLLQPSLTRLTETGQLNELFDGDAPHHPGGAIASARAVGELLRCYFEDVLAKEPAAPKDCPSESPVTRVPQVV